MGRVLAVFIAFFPHCSSVTAQEPDPVVVFLSENEEEYSRAADSFRGEMGADVSVHTYSLAGMLYSDPQAKRLLDQARKLRPRFFFGVGQKAFFLLKEEEEIPVVYAGIPDYLSTAIRSAQKTGRLKNINGVFWGDRDCAVEALKAFHELLPGARRVGIVYSRYTESLVEALESEGRRLGVEVHAEKIKTLDQVGPTIRDLATRVDAFLVPKRDRLASRDDVRERILSIATAQNNLPVITTHRADLKRGALALVDLDAARSGKEAAVLARQLRNDEFRKGPVIRDAKSLLFQRKFNVRIARDLRVARPVSTKWEMVE